MSWETILVALVAAAGPLIGTILTLRQQGRLIDYRMGQVEDRIVKLSEKVDSHNSFDRRLVAVETRLEIRQDKQ